MGLDCAECDVTWWWPGTAYGWYDRWPWPDSDSAAEYGLRIDSPTPATPGPNLAMDGVALLCRLMGPGPLRESSGGYSAAWSNVSLWLGAEMEVT